MEIFINTPSDEHGIKELNKFIAIFHATLILEKINDLNIDSISKKKVIKELLEYIKNDDLLENKKKYNIII